MDYEYAYYKILKVNKTTMKRIALFGVGMYLLGAWTWSPIVGGATAQLFNNNPYALLQEEAPIIQIELEQFPDITIGEVYPDVRKNHTPDTSNMTLLGEMLITAYYSPLYPDGMNCSGDCRVTASGHRLMDEEAQYVVACPREYAFGTRLHIEGMDHDVWCRDRGGAIKGLHLDLWMGGHLFGQEAIDWGKKYRQVYLVN